MQSEESNMLVKLAKAVIEHAPEGSDAFWDIKFSDIEAALSAAEPIEQDENPMRFFADNVDKWGALEWFNRMVDACEDHDRKRTQAFRCENLDEKDMLSLSADTSKMIMSSSAFQLARNHKDEIRSALSAQVQDVAGTVAAFERDYPELYWHIAKGKITAGEPLYGAIITDIRGNELGHGESDVSAADAFNIAVSVSNLPAAPAKQEGGE
ncbi:hypothetical protein [Agrobacterium tumefaciens]|uniref:hypothetical protein n=1 Tax=Agrobacterium tumefaciens TaxID=358 RepID=UPI0015726AF9|nr:hypothetical protein [Agrobacterium tumefaciens]